MDKATDPYYLDVGRYPLPVEADVRKKFMQYHVLKQKLRNTADVHVRKQLQEERRKLAQELGTYYPRFVIRKARDRTNDPEFLRELISAGNEGLMIAIDRFDPSRYTNKFLTYAAYWVRVKLDEAVQRRRTVHLTPHMRKKFVMRGEAPPDTTITSLDDVTPSAEVAAALRDDTDVEDEATPHGAYALRCIERVGYSRRTKLLLVWSLGLRGTARSFEEISMIFYMLDGSVCLPTDLQLELEWALNQLRNWLKAHPTVERILREQV